MKVAKKSIFCESFENFVDPCDNKSRLIIRLTNFAFCDSKWIDRQNVFKSFRSLFDESQLKCFCALLHSSLVKYPIRFAPARHANTKTSSESGANSTTSLTNKKFSQNRRFYFF